jgi:pyruvate kinase
MDRRAKIVATLGPASADRSSLSRLLRAGVDVVRLNVSHGERDQHRQVIRLVRELDRELSRFTAVVVDLMGPRYRLGQVAQGVVLRRGQTVTLGSAKGAELDLDDDILEHVRTGERVLIDNGLVEMEVLAKRRGLLRAKVVSGGPVSTRKGINLPDSDLPFSVSAKDRADIEMAVEEQADYLAASYVGSARDVAAVRTAGERAGGALPVIAKLERGRAVDHVEEIVVASDAVMVARGDLGVEVPLHRVPVIQKRIVEAGLRHAKPVIVATQMLESMMEHPRPTRAESSDVANAVFDGADAMMLSGDAHQPAAPAPGAPGLSRGGSELSQETSRSATTSRLRDPAPDLPALIPEEYGGAGVPAAAGRRCARRDPRDDPRFSGCNAAACHAQMYTMGTLLRHGSEEQKRRWLPEDRSGAAAPAGVRGHRAHHRLRHHPAAHARRARATATWSTARRSGPAGRCTRT